MRLTPLLPLFALLAIPLSAQIQFEHTTRKATATTGQETIELAFPFKNVGTEPVVIQDIHSGCGCTVPELTTRNYPPDAAGVLKVRFNPHNRQGLQRQIVTVRTDAGDHALTVEVDLPQRVLITPRLLIFRTADLSAREMTLAFDSDTPVSDVRVLGDSGPFTVRLVEREPGKTYTVAIELPTPPATDARVTLQVQSRTASGLVHNDAIFLRYAP